MPSWGEIGREIATVSPAVLAGASSLDYVRRKYIAELYGLSGRAVILYATRWTVANPGIPIPPGMLSISFGDIHGFMEALHGVRERELDLLIHSPGGSPEAAEGIVQYLRSKFDHIRVFVPHMAMSAATMIACAADEIVMGKHSFIGPIDPQLQLQTALGLRLVPAQAIVEQFERAVSECQDPAKLRAWLPMLNQFGPDLLVTCQNANRLSQSLVSDWLREYMFRNEIDPSKKANEVASWMADHSWFKTHGRPISRDLARRQGMRITDLEADDKLQDAVLSIYHAVAHCFSQAMVVKIIENHLGKAFMDQVAPPVPPMPLAFSIPAPIPPAPP